MKKVFLSGSINIKSLSCEVIVRLNNMIQNKLNIMIGDAKGADLAFQEFFHDQNYKKVTVYCVGRARNNVSEWKTETIVTKHRPGTRAYFTAKDEVMAQTCDLGFMVWDAKSPGTLKNVIELLKLNKRSVVYIHNKNTFIDVKSLHDLELLTEYMSHTDFEAANKKLKIVGLIIKNQATQQEFSID